jgi:flavodoxin
MKFLMLMVLSLFMIQSLMFQDQARAQDQAQSDRKILVAYFSWSGNAKSLAEQVAAETGGELFEIKTVNPYPDNYDDCIDVAKKEQNSNARPALQGALPDIAQYNTIFLCYPNWWGTLPMAVFTFLESIDVSGKTIYPLVTHGGSRFGSSLDDMKKIAPQAAIGEGLSISSFDKEPNNPPTVKTPKSEVSQWLSKIGFNR